jgi:hypothetical protein
VIIRLARLREEAADSPDSEADDSLR